MTGKENWQMGLGEQRLGDNMSVINIIIVLFVVTSLSVCIEKCNGGGAEDDLIEPPSVGDSLSRSQHQHSTSTRINAN